MLHAINRRAANGFGLALIAVLALPLGGCDTQKILEVTDPDILTPGSISGPEALPTVRRAALGEFALAYGGSGAEGSGGTEGVIMYSGLLGDEWVNSETFPTRIEIDRRTTQITNGTMGAWFRTLSRARVRTEFAARGYVEFAANPDEEPGYAETLALAGFTYLFFAENWCSGVPFSRANPDGSITYGDPLTMTQMLDTALARFDTALAVATTADDDDLADLARVGRGRALLGKGQFATASAAVTGVPTAFAYMVTYSLNSARQQNGVFNANGANERYSVANGEGGVGLAYRSANDPRISFERTFVVDDAGDTTFDVGFDRATAQFDQLRYPSREASIPLATGLEARLIEAEAQMNTGGLGASGSYIATLNALRSTPPAYIQADGDPIPALTDLSDPGIDTARVSQLMQERAFWLWITGHRLSDMRRLVRQYARPVNAVFPNGTYFKGNAYGADVNFPVPFDEENNPKFEQCLDRLP